MQDCMHMEGGQNGTIGGLEWYSYSLLKKLCLGEYKIGTEKASQGGRKSLRKMQL
jgi:hypothetical protein